MDPRRPSSGMLDEALLRAARANRMGPEGIARLLAEQDPIALFQRLAPDSLQQCPVPWESLNWACWIALYSTRRECFLEWIERSEQTRRSTLWLYWALEWNWECLPVMDLLTALGLEASLGPCINDSLELEIRDFPGVLDFGSLPIHHRHLALVRCHGIREVVLRYPAPITDWAVLPSLRVQDCAGLQEIHLHTFEGMGKLEVRSCPDLRQITAFAIELRVPEFHICDCPSLQQLPEQLRAGRLEWAGPMVISTFPRSIRIEHPDHALVLEDLRLLSEQAMDHLVCKKAIRLSRLSSSHDLRIAWLYAGEDLVLEDLPDLERVTIEDGTCEGDLIIKNCGQLRLIEGGAMIKGKVRSEGHPLLVVNVLQETLLEWTRTVQA